MATYLQGVTDYIPDYQPFQPDLNFYGKLLEAKQSQYDTNWKQLNNVYGQLYGADLTHDSNIEKKDELLRQIDFNLKRVSGLDLSLEQNVNQAMTVFKPFYEDKYLMKDMAWTKNWNNVYSSANALKNSQDDKQRKQWWSTGIQGLELRRQMFKDSDLEETLGMRNATYTPFVNTTQEYMELAKKYNVGAVQQAPDQSGLYLVRKKNGELILPTLQNMFLAEYSNRPDIQDMYREAAFVERMNYSYQNADKFGGNKIEAEKEYIMQKYDYIKKYASDKNSAAQDELNTASNLKAGLEKDISEGNVNPQQANYGKSLEELFAVNSAIASNAENLNNQVNDKQSTAVEQGYNEDILGDLELARLKIDSGYASIAAEQDIINAANSYAFSNAEIEYKPNAVGLEKLRHSNALERDRIAHERRLTELGVSNDSKMFQKAVDFNVSKGYWSFTQDGKLNTNPQANGYAFNFTTPSNGSTTDGIYSFDELQEKTTNELIKQNASAGVTDLMTIIQNGLDQSTGKSFTAAQLAQIVSKFNPSDPTAKRILKEGSTASNYKAIKQVWNGIWNDYKKDPNKFVLKYTTTGQTYNLNDYLKEWSSKHTGSSVAQQYFGSKNIIDLDQMARVEDALDVIRQENQSKIRNKFTEDLNFIVKKVKQKDPKTYANVTSEKIDKAVDLIMSKYTLEGKGHTDEFYKIAPEIDREVAKILGFNIGKETTQKSSAKWYNYVFPLTNIARIGSDGKETISETASWVKDVFDESFNELTNLSPDKGGLQPFFSNIGKKAGSGNKYALVTETGNIKVAPGIHWDPGNQAAGQMMNTILGMNWNQDQSKYRITTNGNILPGSDEEWENKGITQNEALAIARELKNRLNTDKDLDPFFLGATQISMENAKLGSMKLMAPRDVIEKVIKSSNEGTAKESEIKAKIDKIYQDGITFIAPKYVWESNSLFNDQSPTPAQVLLNTGPIKYKDPRGAGSYVIEKVPGQADYRGTVELYELRPDGTKIVHSAPIDLGVRSGRTIEDKEKEMHSMILEAALKNLEMYRRMHATGDQNTIQRAIQNFGSTK